MLLCLFNLNVISQTTLQANLFSSNFNAPVDITNSGDSRMFVVERGGKIFILDSNGTKLTVPFLDIDSIVTNGGGERGLLSMVFHPNYINNGFFFVYFIDNSGNSQIARYSRNPNNANEALATSKQIVLSVTQPSTTNHKGGDLNFGVDGNLYFGFGDGGGSGDPSGNSQNLQTLLGKIIRINVDNLPYTIPINNPFIGSAPLDEIWNYGLRNPWRWSFDRLTHDMWIADVGQGSYEEINFQSANSNGGENYGWRCYEGNSTYNTSGCQSQSNYDFPIYVYPHSGPNSGCSATGGYVYRGTKYNSLFGKYLFADYCSGNIWSLDESYNLTNHGTYGFGIASFGEDVYGELYIANVSNGNVYKLSTNECKPVAYINHPDTSYLCTGSITLLSLYNPELNYQWLRNGFPIPNGTDFFYTLNVGSEYRVIVTNQLGCSDTSSAKLVINNRPDATISGDNNFCIGNTATLNTNVGNGLTYQWKFKNIDILNANSSSYNADKSGNYRVFITNNLGCTRLSNPFNVVGPPKGGTILNGSSTICIGDSSEIISKATGLPYSYQWYRNSVAIPGANNQNYYITSTGFYKVMVTNQFGCSKLGSGKVVIANNCKLNNDEFYDRYTLLSIDGKLVDNGYFYSTDNNYINYLKDKNYNLNGIFILKVYDKNFKNIKIHKIIL